MRALAAVLVLLVLAVPALVPAPADAQVFGAITGPTALAPRQTAQYNVTVTGPPGSVNYSLEYFLEGTDLTAANPLENSPGRASGNQTTFRIDVTAPEKEQTVTLVVKISATVGGRQENATARTSVLVIAPIILEATFRNAASTAALNVTVRFYVDDALVGTRTIARIPGTGQESASFDYLPVGIQPGAHRVRIEADLDSDGRIDPTRGEVVTFQIFYRETPPLGQGWSLVLGIVVFFAAFFLTVAWRRRKQT